MFPKGPATMWPIGVITVVVIRTPITDACLHQRHTKRVWFSLDLILLNTTKHMIPMPGFLPTLSATAVGGQAWVDAFGARILAS